MEIKIRYLNRELIANRGEMLADALIRNGIPISRPCGGKGVCGKCRVIIDGESLLACKYVLTHDITVEATPEGEILSDISAKITDTSTGTDLVLDLGTTTLALALIDKKRNCIIKVVKANNPQRAFGADVISRIGYCRSHGVKDLTCAIRDEVRRMISEIGCLGLDTLYVVGNTTMLHIFAGVDPSPMGSAPYTPDFLSETFLSAQELEIREVKTVCLFPSVSAFVGADIVAGINYLCKIPQSKYILLVDLGTNAEIALIAKNKIITTSAAAGPCFEGANISCGMSATDGAIYYYDGIKTSTVNGLPARGICATGLVDIIAFLLRRGKIDASGMLDEEEFEVAPGISITREDIRQYQLAKSAIYSAILTVMDKFGVGFDDIETLYIAGGFSSKMLPHNAALTGLIPTELTDRCFSIGNSSLMGAIKAACENIELHKIADRAIYVDLSSDSSFADRFIKNMSFK